MAQNTKEITMFIDTSKCIGCKACQVACKQWHSLPAETDEGTANGTSTSTTLVDEARTPTTPLTNPLSWAVNQWAGRGVEVFFAGGHEKRTIVSNKADTLTVSPAFGTIPSTETYALTTAFNGSYTNPPDMSGNNLTVVKFKESVGLEGLKFLFLKDQCRHCYQPKCKLGMPGGVYQTDEGFVLFSSNCNDAHLKPRKITNPNFNPGAPVSKTNPKKIPMTFAQHCPYNIPRLSTTLNQYVKCDFCYDRFAIDDNRPKGGTIPDIFRNKNKPFGITISRTTACELACPSNAIVTGLYSEIMGNRVHYNWSRPDLDDYVGPDYKNKFTEGYAKRRYREVRKDYPFARLYTGYKGRTNVIYLLTETPDKYGLPTSEKPLWE